MSRSTRVAIALGSNMNNRFELLRSGVSGIAAMAGVTLLASSQVDETEAFGPPQAAYLNQIITIGTKLSLPALLTELQALEALHGRVRSTRKGPRTLDLDIVWADGLTVTSSDLLVPHPGLLTRDFWQRQLAEVLGVDEAADAIASARVHAGMDTAGGDDSVDRHRWSGSWETVA